MANYYNNSPSAIITDIFPEHSWNMDLFRSRKKGKNMEKNEKNDKKDENKKENPFAEMKWNSMTELEKKKKKNVSFRTFSSFRERFNRWEESQPKIFFDSLAEILGFKSTCLHSTIDQYSEISMLELAMSTLLPRAPVKGVDTTMTRSPRPRGPSMIA